MVGNFSVPFEKIGFGDSQNFDVMDRGDPPVSNDESLGISRQPRKRESRR